MATLLILLLGTMLVQGSTLALSELNEAKQPIAARAVFIDEFRTAALTHSTLLMATLYGYVARRYVLQPLDAPYLETPVLLFGAAVIFLIARRMLTAIPGVIIWPSVLTHLTSQAALLGMALFSVTYVESLAEALGYGIGAATTLATLSACFNALRERIDLHDVPIGFRGVPIALITAGFMALALMGFAGMVRH